MRFLANDLVVETEAWEGSPALDFIRRDLGLAGTKEGCREGDCGACAVLVGERDPGAERYRAVPSCLLALGELEDSHLVTIEGLSKDAPEGLTPVMRAILAENGSQCGFCSPGFVISLTAFLLAGPPLTIEGALRAVEGNLCRCTGYGSIRRAAERLIAQFASLPPDFGGRVAALEAAKVVPPSLGAYLRGELLPPAAPGGRVGGAATAAAATELPLGGGTDYYVRNPDPELIREKAGGRYPAVALLDRRPRLRSVRRVESEGAEWLEIGASLTWTDFFANAEVRALVPGIENHESKLASVLIRNRATLGGNVANASPVADLTSMLIALGARVGLEGGQEGGAEGAPAGEGGRRSLPLQELFLGYKRLDLRPGESIASFSLPIGPAPVRFNFEKAAKRANLDIAAVNTACVFGVEGGRILGARISAGGVAPTPLFLANTSAFVAGKAVDGELARAAAAMAAAEVKPIGDVRGSADYRKRVLERLVLAHFIVLFPEAGLEEVKLP